jgi:FlaA1/EpsC-like NDP-sugar epimerase
MLHRIVTHHKIEQIVISSPSITEERINEILRECEAQNIELKRMAIRIESIGEQGPSAVPFVTRNGD